MPSFVIMQQSGKIGETFDATLCDAAGFPDRQSDVPVRVRRISDHVLAIDDQPRSVISSVGTNGTITYLVNGTGSATTRRPHRV